MSTDLTMERYSCLPRPLVLALLAVVVVCLSAMTSREVMTPEFTKAKEAEQSVPVGLNVRGASAGIQPEYFEEQLIEEITSGHIFSWIDENDGKPYSLNVRIIEVKAPSFSLRMAVEMNAIWDLIRVSDGTKILHEKIHSIYRGGAFEGGLIGANRVRAAAEGAARENIRQGLNRITTLHLDSESPAITLTSISENVQ